jgi:hypothetical protein
MAEHKELGFDDSPPRNTLILAVGVASVLTLALLTPLFTGYFDHMVQAENAAKNQEARARANPVNANREAQERQLSSARVSVDDAMRQLASVGRRVGPAPQPSTDTQAVLGWNQLENEAAAAEAARAAGVPAEGEAPAEGETQAEGETPADGEAPAEGAAPAPTDGETPEGQNE